MGYKGDLPHWVNADGNVMQLQQDWDSHYNRNWISILKDWEVVLNSWLCISFYDWISDVSSFTFCWQRASTHHPHQELKINLRFALFFFLGCLMDSPRWLNWQFLEFFNQALRDNVAFGALVVLCGRTIRKESHPIQGRALKCGCCWWFDNKETERIDSLNNRLFHLDFERLNRRSFPYYW